MNNAARAALHFCGSVQAMLVQVAANVCGLFASRAVNGLKLAIP